MTGEELKAWRKAQDLTQDAAAEILGVDQTTLSRWEHRTPRNPADDRFFH